ncbi:MAG: penicillin-binding protein 3 [Phycisphaerae bacterium]
MDSKPASQRVWVGQVLIGALSVVLVGLVGRLTYIQAAMRPELVAYSEERQKSEIRLPGRRGGILDCRGRLLAGSHDQSTIYADPRHIDDHAAAAATLAPILNMEARAIQDRLDDPSSPAYVELMQGVGDDVVTAIRKLGLRGLGVTKGPARVYPMGSLAAHVLGGITSDGRGLEGVEMSFERYLKFKPGKRVVYWDSRRRNPMFQDPVAYTAPQDGLDVVLTLDAAIQETVERELTRVLEKFQAECVMGIVLNCKTGAVLAMACAPAFSPAAPGKSPAAHRRNRLLTDPVEPGSIFKPFVLVGALAAGLARPTETIFCHNGVLALGRRLLHDHHPYGDLTVEQIITKSSNIGMAIIGQRMGNPLIYETLHGLGLGEKTGIDLPGEDRGLLMPLPRWKHYTTVSVPMGQELALTPIQLATAFCALVNGGRLPKPHVVAGVMDRQGQVIEDCRPKDEPRQVIDPTVAATMKDILVKVVNEGTGKPSQLDYWQVMGKTGTAQVPWSPEARREGRRRGYEPDAYLGSFLAAAPASDPAVVALVMVRKPKRSIGYYGGTVAAPAVKAILQEVLPYLNVPHDRDPTAKDAVRPVADLRD